MHEFPKLFCLQFAMHVEGFEKETKEKLRIEEGMRIAVNGDTELHVRHDSKSDTKDAGEFHTAL